MFFRKNKKRIVFFNLEEWEQKHIKNSLKGFDIEFVNKPLTIENVDKYKNTQIIGVFLYSKITSEVLAKLPKLELIATLSTGYDHIDLEECNRRNITVCNVPNYGENTVAEHTFALILTISRKVFQSIERTKSGSFDYEGLTGFDLQGKTIGLIGTGRISSHVARIAYGFGMNILGYDINQNPELITKYGLKYVDITFLLKNSDIISLHLPLNDKTKHIINHNNISLMKSTAVLINTARGGLIETDALVKALQSKKIGGAGLDVLEEECFIKEEKQILSEECNKTCNTSTLIANHALLKLDNVIVTPHNAFNSSEALRRIIDTSIENIKGFEKKTPQNVVAELIPKHI